MYGTSGSVVKEAAGWVLATPFEEETGWRHCVKEDLEREREEEASESLPSSNCPSWADSW